MNNSRKTATTVSLSVIAWPTIHRLWGAFRRLTLGLEQSLNEAIATTTIPHVRASERLQNHMGRCETRLGRNTVLKSAVLACPRAAAVGGRPTVGHVALDHGIGVRIPASQPTPARDVRAQGCRMSNEAIQG